MQFAEAVDAHQSDARQQSLFFSFLSWNAATENQELVWLVSVKSNCTHLYYYQGITVNALHLSF